MAENSNNDGKHAEDISIDSENQNLNRICAEHESCIGIIKIQAWDMEDRSFDHGH